MENGEGSVPMQILFLRRGRGRWKEPGEHVRAFAKKKSSEMLNQGFDERTGEGLPLHLKRNRANLYWNSKFLKLNADILVAIRAIISSPLRYILSGIDEEELR
jgi:hypothetical protein